MPRSKLLLFAAAMLLGREAYSFTTPRLAYSPSTLLAAAVSAQPEGPPKDFAIVGGGPAGLLLAHLLLDKNKDASVTLYESRPDPRTVDAASADARAYALGIGRRGRTAVRAVDEALWQAIAARGYRSSRFQLHVGPFVIPLRDDRDGFQDSENEPSLLLFQTDLCGAMVEELETRYKESGRIKLFFEEFVKECKLDSKTVVSTSGTDSFDLIIGCDGVNSIVRRSVDEAFPEFESTVKRLPGIFKVIKLDKIPGNKIDPTSVSLIMPKSGATGAFVEPTGNDGSCCVLFSGKEGVKEDKSDMNVIFENDSNVTAVREALEAAFSHKFNDEASIDTMARQLVAQTRPGRASSVQCNTYHFGDVAVLIGDAAHATGGVSGQGVNSALVDAWVLAEELTNDNGASLQERLFRFSARQVPEGKALYELSFPPKYESFPKKIRSAFVNARDSLFRGRFGIGRLPLQTRLTTSLVPFADLRRERDNDYDNSFPSQEYFEEKLKELDRQAAKALGKKASKDTAISTK